MNRISLNIKNRLSLRQPQTDSLEILEKLADTIALEKGAPLQPALEAIRALHPDTFSDFERNFPSVCFALATGVGKTRLMGAFIAYLNLAKGIRNFFVLAPNLTIYNKLIDDLSNTNSPKYVFRGIGEYAATTPQIVTGDTYHHHHAARPERPDDYQARLGLEREHQIYINIFNISKINAEARSGAEPKIKRLSEYIGESYFNYLAGLSDLVLIMDESHHYRADRGMSVLNELNPILGLELTATPIDPSGQKFKNVLYDYPLGRAMNDGFVKEPAVATRRDFVPSNYSDEDLDRIKIDDGIRIHEKTKLELEIYSRDNGVPYVKPFVLIVARDTTHSAAIKQYVQSPEFFKGQYADKVMEIHSNQRGAEKEENIEKLLTVEEPRNPIEIVIHVNMLKEGWDVTNLYTIVPLRTAASVILTEQTIGRGLRLPYGKRTGNINVDKLTIVAHDHFQKIVEEANKPDSLIKKERIIYIEDEGVDERKVVIVSSPVITQKYDEQKQQVMASTLSEEKKEEALAEIEIKKVAYLEIVNLKNADNVQELRNSYATLSELVAARMDKGPQETFFKEERREKIIKACKAAIEEKIKIEIKIPSISIVPDGEVRAVFNDFDLDVSGGTLKLQPVSEEIYERILNRKEDNIIIHKLRGARSAERLEDRIVAHLIDFEEIDYDEHANLLYKLAGQATAFFGSYLKEEEVENVVMYHKRDIARYIYAQMKAHFFVEARAFIPTVTKSWTTIKPHNLSRVENESPHHYSETVEPAKTIPSKLFIGFQKSCHPALKFDSKSEKDFAAILESEGGVIKWLRPAPMQFSIYWDHDKKNYEPDFIAETKDAIYLVEIKAEKDMETREVKEKAKAAIEYCKNATEYNAKHGEKPWHYVLIPHDAVQSNASFDALTGRWEAQP
ncbi:MAG TPA: DEAD/DEAH box helicase family protein [bacterium]|nr:DEAD/DEAH box helicase family protein [bacterium]